MQSMKQTFSKMKAELTLIALILTLGLSAEI